MDLESSPWSQNHFSMDPEPFPWSQDQSYESRAIPMEPEPFLCGCRTIPMDPGPILWIQSHPHGARIISLRIQGNPPDPEPSPWINPLDSEPALRSSHHLHHSITSPTELSSSPPPSHRVALPTYTPLPYPPWTPTSPSAPGPNEVTARSLPFGSKALISMPQLF